MSESDANPTVGTLRVLHLEDSQDDNALIRAELEHEWVGLELLRVETRETFVRALEEFKPDVVLCGMQLPAFDGRSALQIVRQAHPEIPVVMVTAVLGDNEAVELIKMGARDCVLKDRLPGLIPAVHGALWLEQGIRARKKIEHALRENEPRYQAIMATANDAIICAKPDGAVYLWNHKAEEMFGYIAAEAIERNLYDLISPQHYRKHALQALPRFARAGSGPIVGKTVQLTARRKDNSEFPVELSISSMQIGGEWHTTSIIRDITERKQNEAKIQRLNLLYAALSQFNQVIVRSKNEQELFAQICRSAVRVGRFKMAWVGRIDPVSHMVIPVASSGEGAEEYLRDIKISVDADSEFGQGPTGRALRENQPAWCHDFPHSALTAPWRKRGDVLGWRSSAALPLCRNGVVIAAFSLYAKEENAFDEAVRGLLLEMSADVNYTLDHFSHEIERKRAEELLRSSEERLQLSQTAAAVGTWEWDLESKVAQCSDSYFSIFGLPQTSSPLTYAAWLERIHPADREQAVADIRQVQSTNTDYRAVYRIIRTDGSIRWLESKAHVRRNAGGRPLSMLGAVIDITERKQLEEQLVAQYEHVSGVNAQLVESNKQLEQAQLKLMQSEKMAAVGLLAAGVAHEINNPIGYVSSNLGTLERYLADIFVVLDKYAEAEVLLVADQPLLHELRQIKAKLNLGYVREDVKSLIAESHQGLKRVKDIVLDLRDFSHYDGEDQWVWADVHKGLESTLNVVRNELKYKCDVVKEYGALPKIYCLPSQLNQVFMNLLVNAAQAIEVHGKVTIRSGQEGERIWIEVADTGMGIPPENIPRLFDPFFTTKPVGKGTGLGLAVSFKIVEKHHGRIEVQSEAGAGATFRVILPVQPDINKENA